MRYYLTALILMLSLTACTAGSSNYTNVAPPVKPYPKTQTTHVATELKECQDTTIDHCTQTIEFLKDYKVMRDQARIGTTNASTR